MTEVLSPTDSPLDGEDCWRAVLSRDTRADGAFVYGVRSTGIYCRPSCPSRRPRRELVLFLPTPADAEEQGFRACRRCRPGEAAVHAAMVRRVCRYIEEHLEEAPDLDTLGEEAGVSPSHLQRTFKRILGVTPREYADALRLERFKGCIKEGAGVTDAIYEAGYGSSSRLYERAASHLGMTPTAYRQGGKGLRIGYAVAGCPLGHLLVAATSRGICAVSLGDSEAELTAALRGEYPAADLQPDPTHLQEWVEALLRYLQGEQRHLDLPLDVQATAFQWRVWKHLQSIPYGSTRSYGEIARELGQPEAARAVAQACATNPVALIVPCHRVVRGDGGLAGYRWGADRKQTLLEGEKG
jgi:AraC family transcriptional regulator, regulatory protein of adaptative response / methylated-DNA-[protein]-cysteine methyltransferase